MSKQNCVCPGNLEEPGLQGWPEPDVQGRDKHKPIGSPQIKQRRSEGRSTSTKPNSGLRWSERGQWQSRASGSTLLPRTSPAWGSFWVRNIWKWSLFWTVLNSFFCELIQLLLKPHLECGDYNDEVTPSASQIPADLIWREIPAWPHPGIAGEQGKKWVSAARLCTKEKCPHHISLNCCERVESLQLFWALLPITWLFWAVSIWFSPSKKLHCLLD